MATGDAERESSAPTDAGRKKIGFRQKETSNEGRLKADRMNDWMQTE